MIARQCLAEKHRYLGQAYSSAPTPSSGYRVVVYETIEAANVVRGCFGPDRHRHLVICASCVSVNGTYTTAFAPEQLVV